MKLFKNYLFKYSKNKNFKSKNLYYFFFFKLNAKYFYNFYFINYSNKYMNLK
jgi:hypothetical protein